MFRTSLAATLLLASAPLFAQDLQIEFVAQVTAPTCIVQPPGESHRLFVTSQEGQIWIIENGVLDSRPFLDVEMLAGGLDAFGILSMTFHPDYQTNGKFYVAYLDSAVTAHVAQFEVSAIDPNVADPASRVQILGPYAKQYRSHGWNHMWFGPDGMLYISTGDDRHGGLSNENSAQDLADINGKVLRLDVDAPAPYVPADNPFLGIAGVDERVYAYGLRQPWRMTYDRIGNHFFVADVGAQDFEEISVIDFTGLAGANFGWRCVEATTCTNIADGCPLGCNDPNRIDPIFEYRQTGGLCAVIGGVVYRGSSIPSLEGKYFFSDYCTRRFWSFRWDGAAIVDFVDHSGDLTTATGVPIGFTTSYGVDNAGEVYICDQTSRAIWKLVAEPGIANYCMTSPNSAGAGATISSLGTESVSAADLTLTIASAPPHSFGLFYYGQDAAQLALGEGVGCVGAGNLFYFRFNPAMLSDVTGHASLRIDFTSAPAGVGLGRFEPGATWHFQYWYRDSIGGAAVFNFSDGLRVTFAP